MLGITNYGARSIARVSDDKKKMSAQFSNIYSLQLILTLLMIVLYFAFVIYLYPYNLKIMFIQSLFLFSVAFDINCFFFGIEKFKITISRNIIIKVSSLVFIFAFVKETEDLWKYTLIMSFSTLISQMYMWLYLKKYIFFIKPSGSMIIANFRPCLVLFIPVIAYSIYRIMDKTMIGYFADTVQLGNYESAEKIVNIPISFITALGTVMMPHMSKINKTEFKEKIIETYRLIFFFTIPMCFGLFVISDDFSSVFFGKNFMLAGSIIKFLAFSVIFTAIANVIRTSYLIPQGKDTIYVTSTILGALINLIVNLLLIKRLGAYGACIGTVLAEFTVMLYQVIKTASVIEYKKIFSVLFEYICKSIVMVICIYMVGIYIYNVNYRLCVQIFLAIAIYFTINFKYILYDFWGKKSV